MRMASLRSIEERRSSWAWEIRGQYLEVRASSALIRFLTAVNKDGWIWSLMSVLVDSESADCLVFVDGIV